MLRLLVLIVLVSVIVVQCQMLVEDLPEEAADEEDREWVTPKTCRPPSSRGHIAVIRPDYSLWRMVKVLKNMFESRTEKRRQRDCECQFVTQKG